MSTKCRYNKLSYKMCILFINIGSKEDSGDYSVILASNRDEYYDRPSKMMDSWKEDPYVYGGRDLQAGCGQGAWLAISPIRKKIGVLLNLPGTPLQNAKSRGKIVADFIKSDISAKEYASSIKSYGKECNEFIIVSVEYGRQSPAVHTYNNVTDDFTTYTGCLGFGNCLPDQPLKKVEAGKHKLEEICNRLNKIDKKEQLKMELIELLRSRERHLPDPQLESNHPKMFKELSSIFVEAPELRYGTRTHTFILVTKAGHVEVTEVTLEMPVDIDRRWKTTEFQFDLSEMDCEKYST